MLTKPRTHIPLGIWRNVFPKRDILLRLMMVVMVVKNWLGKRQSAFVIGGAELNLQCAVMNGVMFFKR